MKGGEENMGAVCAANGAVQRASVCVDDNTQGGSVCQDETRFESGSNLMPGYKSGVAAERCCKPMALCTLGLGPAGRNTMHRRRVGEGGSIAQICVPCDMHTIHLISGASGTAGERGGVRE